MKCKGQCKAGRDWSLQNKQNCYVCCKHSVQGSRTCLSCVKYWFSFIGIVFSLQQKKSRSAIKDVSLAEAHKVGTFSEFSFFEKVCKADKPTQVGKKSLTCVLLIRSFL